MDLVKRLTAIILIFSYGSAVFSQSLGDTTAVSQPQQTENIESGTVPSSTTNTQAIQPEPPQYAANNYQLNYNDKLASSIAGREDASAKHGTVGWGAFGLASGFLFGLIGVGGASLISIIPSPKPEKMPDTTRVKDGQSYEEAYSSKAKKKNFTTTLLLSSVGWAISIPVVMALKN
ncbi:MAG: hypothetical protein JNL74_13840 [Fibrobacteres bacterium]|nr:hypothetical protein [Fibrobacterota bacterium]